MALAGEYYQLMQFDETRKKKNGSNERPKPIRRESEHSVAREVTGYEQSGKMTASEEHGMQRTGYQAFLRFSKYCGGYGVMSALFFLILLFTLSRLFSGIWLQIWLDEGDGTGGAKWKVSLNYSSLNLTENELKGSVNDNPNLWFYQTVYGLSFIVMMLIGMVKGMGIVRQLLLGSSRLHQTMLQKVMKCPISFFDVTPPGKILQHFSRDMDEVDVRLPFFFEFVWQGLMFVITQLVLVCFIFPVFSIALFVVAGLFAFLDVWLNKGLREAKKIDNFLKSPVLDHIASSMAGLSIIRAYGRHKVFLERFCTRLNRTLASDFMFRSSMRWFTFRMDMVVVATVTLTSLVVVLLRSSASSAQAGLVLSCVFAVSTFVPYVMQLKSEMQARFTSVERILEYAEELEEEENVVKESEDKIGAPENVIGVPPKDWPQNGEIELTNVQLRHGPNLPLVLIGITAKISGGEKVGVVGRTGAGKSSLLGALLRLIKLSAGVIKIDGIDISKVTLRTLRSTIAIIPQDPVLFHGTLRYNLDPFSEYSDEIIWQALEKSHLKEKILLLDEATASVDLGTDSLIQNTVREEFSSCTVITIAHRIHTITSYDRVMVLDAGKVVEFDSPALLMAKSDSLFRQMMEAAGISSISAIE
ncbi:ATP-binding cassette sub-family C member 5-like isoform X2 [Hetaerina americana]|uniref:ATP-binding cassette sub-family C member 5-like isoform X2 n=1 Tax=Hetaerina americana TaxID=62018 RepID=UPI003A7F27E8